MKWKPKTPFQAALLEHFGTKQALIKFMDTNAMRLDRLLKEETKFLYYIPTLCVEMKITPAEMVELICPGFGDQLKKALG